MFEEQGLNIARQADNGSNPRPDNRSGWLEGETPDIVAEHVAAAAPALDVTLWDPSSQLRYRKKSSVRSRPDHAKNAWPGPENAAGSPDQVGSPNAGLRPAA